MLSGAIPTGNTSRPREQFRRGRIGAVKAEPPRFDRRYFKFVLQILPITISFKATHHCFYKRGEQQTLKLVTMTTTKDQITSRVAISNVNVFDGQRFHEATVVIHEGKIESVGTDTGGADVMDGQGKFLIPGLIDAHIHVRGAGNVLENLAAFGVTTALDMASWPPTVANALRGKAGLPDIRSAGIPATSPGSTHSQIPGLGEFLIRTPEEAAPWVADRVSEGVDFIKVVADVPGPDQATLNALIAAAQKHGKMTIAHASKNVPFSMALEAHADVITHVPLDKALDSAAIAQMVRNKQISVPTLAICEALSEMRGPPLNYAESRASVKALYAAGVPILAGTDATGPGSPCPLPHGDSLHHELELLVDAGLSTVDVLRAVTVLPAKYFNLEDRGVIAKDLRADLVLLSANPLDDIRASREIEHIWIGGIECLVK